MSANGSLSAKRTTRSETRRQSNPSEPNDKPPKPIEPENGVTGKKLKPANHDEPLDQPPEPDEESIQLTSDESEEESEMNDSYIESQDYHSSDDDQRSDNNEERPVIVGEESDSERSVGDAEEEEMFLQVFDVILDALGGPYRLAGPRNEPDLEMDEF